MEIEMKLHFYTTNDCNVCHSLLPKLRNLLTLKFPRTILELHSIEEDPKTAADFGVYTAPTALLTLDGTEVGRWVRNFGIIEIEQKLERIISLINE